MNVGELYAVSSGLFFSFSLILMRVAGYQIPPMALNFFKCSVALILVLITLVLLGEPILVDLPIADYVRLMLSAIIGIAIADTMIVAALNRLGASLQALASCAYAPSVSLVGFILFGEVLNSWELMGGALVLSGVLVGATVTAEIKKPRDLWVGILLAVGAHMTMAVAILMIRDIYREESVLWVCSFRFFIAALAMLVYANIKFSGRVKGTLLLGFYSPHLWRTIVPMAVLAPFLATLCWVAGFKYLEAGRAAIYNQLSTVFIIILAYFLLGEKLTKRKMMGVSLALAGAVLVASH